jgi:hypothetical protein
MWMIADLQTIPELSSNLAGHMERSLNGNRSFNSARILRITGWHYVSEHSVAINGK